MDYLALTLGLVLLAVTILAIIIFNYTMKSYKNEEESPVAIAENDARSDVMAKTLNIFISPLILGFIIWVLLSSISNLFTILLAPSVFLITQSSVMFIFPALFLGWFLTPILTKPLIVHLLGVKQWQLFVANIIKAKGRNTLKLYRYLGFLFIPVAFLYSFLALDNYVKITEKTFTLNEFLSVGKTEYQFNQVTTVMLFKSFSKPNGNFVEKPHFCIIFNTGKVYDMFHTLPANELNFEQQAQLAEFIAMNSNIEIVVFEKEPNRNNECLSSI